METSLVVPGPLDMARTLARFRLWGEDPANQLAEGAFRRAVKVDGQWYGYRLTWTGGPDGARLSIVVPGFTRARVLDAAIAEIRQICGLDADLPSFYRVAGSDQVLASLVPRLYGLRPTLSPGPFEMLVGSVC